MDTRHLKPEKPRQYKLAGDREYDTIERMVMMGVSLGLISRDEKNEVFAYIDETYKADTFYEPFDVDFSNGQIRIPYTLNNLKSFLKQREWEIDLRKKENCKAAPKASLFPKELDSDAAHKLIEKAIDRGFIVVEKGCYKWTGEKVLLAYFATKATAYLSLKKREGAYASWKPFETLLGEKNLKNAKTDYEKYHAEFYPSGAECIDTLFE